MIEVTMQFICSQMFVFCAMIFDFMAFQFKKRKQIFFCLMLSTVFVSLQYFLLNKKAAAILMLLSSLRFAIYYLTKNKNYLYLFIATNTISLFFTYKEMYDVIIYSSSVIFIIGMLQKEDALMREIMGISMTLAIVYNILIFSPMGVVAETSILISNLVGYYKYHKKLTPEQMIAIK